MENRDKQGLRDGQRETPGREREDRERAGREREQRKKNKNQEEKWGRRSLGGLKIDQYLR